ncbi:MAG TPA: hypothetical protein VF897_17705 [Roseiflexaceae bacterium]
MAEAARRISGSLPPAGRQRDGAPIAAPTAQARIASAAETIAAVPTAASAFRHTDDPDPAEQRRGAGPGSSGQVRGAGANDQPITPRREPPPQARSRPPGSTRRAPPIPAGPPTIRVTIGRVEVRTTPGPAPAPARRGGQTQPGLSLDEYLRSRNRGRRE